MSEHWKKYSYHIEPDADTTATKILRLIGQNRRVLELGTAVGSMTQLIREANNCTVVGMEIDPEMAKMAAPWCERMIVGNIESMDLTETLGEDRFDVIVAADVLEHLYDPWACLLKIRSYLRPEGFIVLSVPNVAHNALLAELLSGRFPYQEKGLLDRTHLRFFTRSNLEEMLFASGYLPSKWDRNLVAESATEFALDWKNTSSQVKASLADNIEGQTYQFIVKAFPSTETGWVQKTGSDLQSVEQAKQKLEETLTTTMAELAATQAELLATKNELSRQRQDKDAAEATSLAVNASLSEAQTTLCGIQNRPYAYALRRMILKARRILGLD
ncbi:MAG: class I SAM-dependent methyltransferase [Gammaproteobacteria bacterium]|nr:class I SAM-dependent methyltransferase [Gammaproteobacteria bacterium]MBU1732209.1 class I SAM-dependent methyltransferase [Gammaproteobacteria bacterium]MBU1893261.1 class I SAM-dependent methyltransferase [Gammaproteobacteria bacterium]